MYMTVNAPPGPSVIDWEMWDPAQPDVIQEFKSASDEDAYKKIGGLLEKQGGRAYLVDARGGKIIGEVRREGTLLKSQSAVTKAGLFIKNFFYGCILAVTFLSALATLFGVTVTDVLNSLR